MTKTLIRLDRATIISENIGNFIAEKHTLHTIFVRLMKNDLAGNHTAHIQDGFVFSFFRGDKLNYFHQMIVDDVHVNSIRFAMVVCREDSDDTCAICTFSDKKPMLRFEKRHPAVMLTHVFDEKFGIELLLKFV